MNTQKQINLKLDESRYKKVRQKAKQHRVSLSEYLRRLIDVDINNNDLLDPILDNNPSHYYQDQASKINILTGQAAVEAVLLMRALLKDEAAINNAKERAIEIIESRLD